MRKPTITIAITASEGVLTFTGIQPRNYIYRAKNFQQDGSHALKNPETSWGRLYERWIPLSTR